MIKGKATKNMFKEYENQIKQFKNSAIKIGLPEKVGGQTHKDSDMTIAQIGAIHEYGVPEKNIPKRSFLREPMLNAQKDINKLIKIKFSAVAENRLSVGRALDQMGLYGQKISQKSFTNNDWASLKPATIKAKGNKSNPLIDSGQLRQSITYIVEKV